MLQDRRDLLIAGHADVGDALSRALDVTGFAAFAEHRNLQPASCSLSDAITFEADLGGPQSSLHASDRWLPACPRGS